MKRFITLLGLLVLFGGCVSPITPQKTSDLQVKIELPTQLAPSEFAGLNILLQDSIFEVTQNDTMSLVEFEYLTISSNKNKTPKTIKGPGTFYLWRGNFDTLKTTPSTMSMSGNKLTITHDFSVNEQVLSVTIHNFKLYKHLLDSNAFDGLISTSVK